MQRQGNCREVEVLSRKRRGDLLDAIVRVLDRDMGRAVPDCIRKEITEVKAAQERMAEAREALRVSEKRYRIAFETSLDAINISRLQDGRLSTAKSIPRHDGSGAKR